MINYTSTIDLLYYKPIALTTIRCSMSSMTTHTKQRITLFINPKIAKHAKAQAIIEDLTLTILVEKALLKYLPKETVIKKPVVEI